MSQFQNPLRKFQRETKEKTNFGVKEDVKRFSLKNLARILTNGRKI